METLEKLLNRFARRKAAQWWAGPRPEGRVRQIPALIAAQVGYPTSDADLSTTDRLLHLTREQAARVLALAGTISLAYGNYSPRTSYVKDALEALGDLTDDATFISNGTWKADTGATWTTRLTNATFECGVMGYDATHAFIFWVEEED